MTPKIDDPDILTAAIAKSVGGEITHIDRLGTVHLLVPTDVTGRTPVTVQGKGSREMAQYGKVIYSSPELAVLEYQMPDKKSFCGIRDGWLVLGTARKLKRRLLPTDNAPRFAFDKFSLKKWQPYSVLETDDGVLSITLQKK